MKDKPFPLAEGELEVFLENLSNKFARYYETLDLSEGDATMLSQYSANFDYLRNFARQVDDAKKSFFSYKNVMIRGKSYQPLVDPNFPSFNLPFPTLPGVVSWTRNLIKKIKSSSNYTKQIGVDLGLVYETSPDKNPSMIVPKLRIAAQNDGSVQIKFSKSDQQGIQIFWRERNSATWQSAGSFFSSPINHHAPSPDDTPQAREYRGILVNKNQQVSQFSPTYTIVTTP